MFLTSFIILIVSFWVHVCLVFLRGVVCVCVCVRSVSLQWGAVANLPSRVLLLTHFRPEPRCVLQWSTGHKVQEFFFLCVKGYVFVCAYARGLTCLAQSHALWSEWLVFFSVGRGSVYIVPTLWRVQGPVFQTGGADGLCTQSWPRLHRNVGKNALIVIDLIPRCL